MMAIVLQPDRKDSDPEGKNAEKINIRVERSGSEEGRRLLE